MEVLETYLGVRYFGEFEYSAPKQSTLLLPSIDTLSNPAFRYRQTQFYGISQDTLYKHFLRRLELPSRVLQATTGCIRLTGFCPLPCMALQIRNITLFLKGKDNREKQASGVSPTRSFLNWFAPNWIPSLKRTLKNRSYPLVKTTETSQTAPARAARKSMMKTGALPEA